MRSARRRSYELHVAIWRGAAELGGLHATDHCEFSPPHGRAREAFLDLKNLGKAPARR